MKITITNSLGSIIKSLVFGDYDDKERSCTRKMKYPRVEVANNAAKAMEAKGRSSMESYKCDYCDGWHIGHSMFQELDDLK